MLLSACAQSGGTSKSVSDSSTPKDQPVAKRLRFFVIQEDTPGNMGGISGADNLCMNSASKPATGVYKAVISGGTRRACLNPNCTESAENISWILKPATTYYRSDGLTIVGTTNPAGIFAFPLQASFSELPYAILTGLNGDWTTGQNCGSWTSSAGTDPVTMGMSDLSTSTSVSNPAFAFATCSFATHMLCVEQ